MMNIDLGITNFSFALDEIHVFDGPCGIYNVLLLF